MCLTLRATLDVLPDDDELDDDDLDDDGDEFDDEEEDDDETDGDDEDEPETWQVRAADAGEKLRTSA